MNTVNEKRKDQAGYGILELILSSLIAGIVLSLAIPAVGGTARSLALVREQSQHESSRRLLGMNFSSVVGRAYSDRIYLDNTMADRLGLGASEFFIGNLNADNSIYPLPSLFYSPNRVLNQTSGTAADNNNSYDLLGIIAQSNTANTLFLSNETTVSAGAAIPGATFTLNITGNVSGYRLNDIVAIQTLQGIELAIIAVVPTSGVTTLQLRVGYASNLPITSLSQGTAISKIDTLVLGANSSHNQLRLVRVSPGTNNTFEEVTNLAATLSKVQLADLTSLANPIVWNPLASFSPIVKTFGPQATQHVLHIEWQDSYQSGRLQRTQSMEIRL